MTNLTTCKFIKQAFRLPLMLNATNKNKKHSFYKTNWPLYYIKTNLVNTKVNNKKVGISCVFIIINFILKVQSGLIFKTAFFVSLRLN